MFNIQLTFDMLISQQDQQQIWCLNVLNEIARKLYSTCGVIHAYHSNAAKEDQINVPDYSIEQ